MVNIKIRAGIRSHFKSNEVTVSRGENSIDLCSDRYGIIKNRFSDIFIFPIASVILLVERCPRVSIAMACDSNFYIRPGQLSLGNCTHRFWPKQLLNFVFFFFEIIIIFYTVLRVCKFLYLKTDKSDKCSRRQPARYFYAGTINTIKY